MKPIELKKWELIPGKPRRLKYAGQPTAQGVFDELRYRLESMGYLPDEYFLMDKEWENGREIPRDADIFCTTDHGVDFEGFSGWAEEQEKDISCDTYQELTGYWQERRQQEPEQGQSM